VEGGIVSASSCELSGYSSLPEPELVFGSDKRHKHPLLGLLANGPYGQRFGVPTKLRLALVAPRSDMKRLGVLVKELNARAEPQEATNYYPVYPGFMNVLRIPIADQDQRLVLEFPDALDEYARRQEKIALASELFDCLSKLSGLRSSFDVALVYLPASWAACFEGESFDCHDYLNSNVRFSLCFASFGHP
jgi:hypothetical protein